MWGGQAERQLLVLDQGYDRQEVFEVGGQGAADLRVAVEEPAWGEQGGGGGQEGLKCKAAE